MVGVARNLLINRLKCRITFSTDINLYRKKWGGGIEFNMSDFVQIQILHEVADINKSGKCNIVAMNKIWLPF